MPPDDAASGAVLLCDPASLATLAPILGAAGVAVADASRFAEAQDRLVGADAVSILGAVAVGAEEAARLEPVCAALEGLIRFEPVELIRLPAGPVDPAALLALVARRLVASRAALASAYGETRLAMAELRMGQERTALAFDELERKAGEFTIPERVLVGQVDGQIAGAGGRLRLAPGTVVAQTLPLVASGLSGVDLFFEEPGAGDLTLSITAAGRDLTLAEARIPSPKAGWRSFEFERAILSDETRIELRIVWTGEAAQAPSLRLGLATPLDAYKVQAGGETIASVLAFRAWRRPPGVRRGAPAGVAPLAQMLVSEPATRSVGSVIAPDMEQVVRDAMPRSLKPIDRLAALVTTKKHLTGVMIHPQRDNVVALSWPLADFPDLARIAARFKLENAEGPPVDVALAIAPAEDVRSALKGLDNWITLHAHQSGVIALDAPAGFDAAGSVLVAASRLNAAAATHVNAWAYLKRLTIWTGG